jgi:hypothetical protein
MRRWLASVVLGNVPSRAAASRSVHRPVITGVAVISGWCSAVRMRARTPSFHRMPRPGDIGRTPVNRSVRVSIPVVSTATRSTSAARRQRQPTCASSQSALTVWWAGKSTDSPVVTASSSRPSRTFMWPSNGCSTSRTESSTTLLSALVEYRSRATLEGPTALWVARNRKPRWLFDSSGR